MELTKPFYSPAEVADIAGLHPSTILNYSRDGKLYAIRLSERAIRNPVRSVQHLLAPEDVRPPVVSSDPDAEVELDEAVEAEELVTA
jgi:predicted site-specific integrase-resolvase